MVSQHYQNSLLSACFLPLNPSATAARMMLFKCKSSHIIPLAQYPARASHHIPCNIKNLSMSYKSSLAPEASLKTPPYLLTTLSPIPVIPSCPGLNLSIPQVHSLFTLLPLVMAHSITSLRSLLRQTS